ncbi:glycoside hydrolase family 27 protein [Sphingomonas sp. Leaf25]|uniref:glycoside hydrolase family 27 protein n=1 Tax=Sphingomonas sp. Leaf25 TaxID=1735692 RepID=UPI000700A3A0|nr:glycoside hydrolase family 27 protein [Sphingomonas sp. Leaf25]KQN03646.1 alpha-galactosidase [Sphingomonas sp. Leaf25]
MTKRLSGLLRTAALSLALVTQAAQAQDQFIDPNTLRPSLDPTRTANGLALTPPMGWNSWNKYGCTITEKIVRDMADAMAGNGMKAAGYTYIVIDDCWHGARDANGFITANAEKFPSGIKALADYIHSKGLKFGIYSDAGAKTCGGKPGSQGHEYQDALTYARWGVDYLKYDWCSTGVRNAEEAYALMADALKASGRPIVLAICEWGNNRPWEWAKKIGNLWRTSSDIRDGWKGREKWSIGMTDIVDLNEPLYPHAGPGHWNDPDMLEVGNGGMSDTEYRAHFSLWAMMAAPLIAGNDIATMNDATKAILLNHEVIAVDQDALGAQGRRVRDDGDREVWSRTLSDGSRAVILFNRGETPAPITATWPEIGYPAGVTAEVRDLWAHKSLGRMTGKFAATVPAHGVVMVRVTPGK